MIVKNEKYMIIVIVLLTLTITFAHYTTSTMNWQYHLVFMQAYFIPIILGAFQFGARGGLGTALLVTALYFPHIMMHWGGFVENNLVRFLQILLFNLLGYLTGLKAEGEKREKERFKQAAEDLQNSLLRLKEQSAKISGMEQQLLMADRLGVIGELTASLAHEVRNPLGSIRGAVEIIRDAVPPDIKKMEFFDILIQDTQRLNNVVENYLSFAKKQPGVLERINLNETIENIVLMIGARIRKNKIQLKTELPDSPLILLGDPNHLWQILMNLLLNGIEAVQDDGVITISAWMTAGKSGEKSIEKYFISVKDNGRGIKDEEINKIFKPFYTTRKEGTGLGLAITKRLADTNNWKIEVESRYGKGAAFTLTMEGQNA